MNLNKKEEKIVREILKLKKTTNITLGNLLTKIIESLKNEIKCQVSKNNKYTFIKCQSFDNNKDENSIEYLILIICTLKKLINNNLLLLLEKNRKNSTLIFLDSNGKELSDSMILEIKDSLNKYIYITSDLKELLKWNFLKIFLIVIFIYSALGGLMAIYYLWNLVLANLGVEMKNIYISYFIIFLIIFLIYSVGKNIKNLINFYTFPYLNENIFNTTLTFGGFLMTTIGLIITIMTL
mgnify:CR=1 FL=1